MITMRKATEALLLVLISVSLILQPTNIRPGGVPVTLSLIAVFILFGFTRPVALPSAQLALAAPFVILGFGDFVLKGELRGLVHLVLLIFVSQMYFKRYEAKALRSVWRVLGVTCTCLAAIGGFRYLTGYQAEFSENISGAVDVLDTYVYYGISYLPATRNSDAFYFGLGAIITFWLLSTATTRTMKVLYAAMFVLNLAATVLSLSRGVWIAVGIAMLLTYRGRVLSAYLGPLLLGLSAVLFYQLTFVWSLLVNGLLSLVDASSANLNVDGYYTYSNEDRLLIYREALLDFIDWPLGHGVGFQPTYVNLTGANTVHSENLYLDMLLILGIFCLPLVYAYFRKLSAATGQLTHDELATLGRSSGLFVAGFAFFNSGVDFVALWTTIGLMFATINSATAGDWRSRAYGLAATSH